MVPSRDATTELHAFWTAPNRRLTAGQAERAMLSKFYRRQLRHDEGGAAGPAKQRWSANDPQVCSIVPSHL